MSEKFCLRGKHYKAVENFSKSAKTKDGLFSWCKSCMATYERERYQNGDSVRKKKNREIFTARNREYIWDYLINHSCVDCDEKDPEVLEFDHVDQTTKEFNISEMMATYSSKNIQKEIDKCVIRCANCHRKRTIQQFGYWKSLKVLDSN